MSSNPPTHLFDLSLVIPAYNEAQLIESTLSDIADYCDAHPEFGSVELVVVAAGDDKTGLLARKFADRFIAFQLIEPEQKVGKGRDVALGMKAARGAKQIFMDADLSTPITHIASTVAALDESEVVIGVRQLSKIHAEVLRTAISLLGNLLIRVVFASKISDTQCGFKGFTFAASQKLFHSVTHLGWGFDIEILQLAKEAKYHVRQLPINDWHEPREEGFRGESSIKAALKTFVELWAIRFAAWGRWAAARRWLDWLAVVAAAGGFAALARQQIGQSSIWFDEAFGAYMIQFSWADIARYTAADVHPPLYYWVLKAWAEMFGASDAALRSLSVALGVVVIWLAFLLVRRLFGRRAAWLGVGLLAISPMLIRYGQEARMYTMVAAIALAATYALVRAQTDDPTSKRRTGWWISYAVLVSAGMWTHYFTAPIWLTHWLWRGLMLRRDGRRGGQWRRALFSRTWLLVHVLAIGLYAAWLPFMLKQLTNVQANGFWIGPVGVDSLTNYFTNIFYYQEHTNATGWLAVGIFVTLGLAWCLGRDVYLRLNEARKRSFILLMLMLLAPAVILFVLSLPPLRSSYVERYVLTAMICWPLLVGVIAALSRAAWWKRALLVLLVVATSAVGITNVYHYGNFNKNTNVDIQTKMVVEQIQARAPAGQPIITDSPWTFYEAIPYATPEHPIYFMDEKTEYKFGSLEMLKHSDQHKIKNLREFSRQHPQVWYMGFSGDRLKPPVEGWRETDHFALYSQLNQRSNYQAAQFVTVE